MSSYTKYKNLGGGRGDKDNNNNNRGSNAFECHRITSEENKKHILGSNILVVVDIYGDWCGPCKTVAPKFYELAQKYNRQGVCALVKENVDDDISSDIEGVPAFDFYIKGVRVHRITGADISMVDAKIQEYIKLVTQ